MLDLFSKFDITFFLTLAISLIIGGAIFYYCYTRLNILEESVINQGKILQSFISGQVNLMPNTLSCEPQLEEPSHTNDKIDISDDESDDGDDDDDGDNDGESDDGESDDGDDQENDNEINIKNMHKIKNAENESDSESSDDDDNKEPYNSLKIDNEHLKGVTQVGIFDLGGSINTETNGVAILGHILDMDKISTTVMETSLEKNEDIKIVDVSKEDLITDITENDENKKKKSLSKMSNKELKDLIIKKNLGNESHIKNLQKKELLEILQNENQSIIEQ